VKVVKNKMAPPFEACEFDILFGEGISKSGDVLDLASEADIVEKSGAWYSYKGERIGQGRENARTYIKERPEMLAQIEREMLVKKGVLRDAPAAAEDAEATKGAKTSGNVATKPEAAAKPAPGAPDAAGSRPRPRA
jgi:recombination protein RecA